MPHVSTSATSICRWAALGWLGVGAVAIYQSVSMSEEWQTAYLAATILGVVAGLLTAVALSRLLARSGQSGRLTSPPVLLALFGVLVVAALYWATIVWTAALTVAAVWAAWSSATGSARRGLWLLLAAWPVSFGLFVALDAMSFGPMDEYGDHPWAAGSGVVAWCLLFAASLFILSAEPEAEPMATPAT